MIARAWRAGLLRVGYPRRHYVKWFAAKFGVYENPYLDATEDLDLRNTYVPLSFRSGDEARETLTVATDVLTEADAGNLIICGAPGSGKSTLLKAYGVGITHGRVHEGGQRGLVPFFVQLRKLARFLTDEKGLSAYLIEHILVSDAGMSHARAAEFLDYSLRKQRVVVMLDGLDEVLADDYDRVRLAIFDFMEDHNPERATHKARLLLTCRQQNFLAFRNDWVPAFGRHEYALAPLRNSEIFSYLDNTRRLFRAPDGPESFMQAVRASRTLELHRTPLILAMSVGLYARRDYFEIPSSIDELYRAMVREMLDRHSFRRDSGRTALQFQVDDKYRFLREFSLHVATHSGGFDDFGEADLQEFAEKLGPQLNAVRDPRAMVAEIIERSGLLSRITETDEATAFVFAHRSIQEYLAAEQLRKDHDDVFLLSRAVDQEWRLVTQFYTAGQEQRQVDTFLDSLAAGNPELAASCLAGAKPSTDVAASVLRRLEPLDAARLAALATATMSPRVPVQEMAIDRLKRALTEEHGFYVQYSIEGLLPLLHSLAGTNAADIAALMPRFMDLSDDPRLVEPLWRCLSIPGIEKLPACRSIVGKLLSIATEPDGFDELARQDRYDRDFLTPALRRAAYPFKGGLDLRHKLVTLLAWAEYLQMDLGPVNRFCAAKAAGRLARVEADKRRTISLDAFRVARLVSGLELAAGAVAFIIFLLMFFLARHSNQPANHNAIWIIPYLAIFAISAAFIIWQGSANGGNAAIHYSRNVNINIYLRSGAPMRITETSLSGAILAIFGAFLIGFISENSSLPLPGLIIQFALQLTFAATSLNVFSEGRRYYLYRPNEYVDMYDDPRSRHWLVPGGGPGL
jgi:NACHT domain